MPGGDAELNELQQWLLTFGRQYLSDLTRWPSVGLSPAQQVLLRQQIEWRKRSRPRFPDPALWLWTDRSLSQASDWWSALFKSSLFPSNELVVDGCCGAGVDAVALVHRGPVFAVDNDPWMTALTRSNSQAHEKEVQAFSEPLSVRSLRGAEWLHVDPDRRNNNRRTIRVEEFSPPLGEILEIAREVAGTIVKLAPGSKGDELQSCSDRSDCLRVWLGSRGECQQQLLVCGRPLIDKLQGLVESQSIAREPARTNDAIAILLNASGKRTLDFSPQLFTGHSVHLSAETAKEPANYVYDLHPVLFASDLHGCWAEQHGLVPLSDEYGFYTGNTLVVTEWASAFETIDLLPWDDRRLRAWLRENEIGHVEVKSRLMPVDANQFQRRYSRRNGDSISLLVTRMDGRTRCLACRRR